MKRLFSFCFLILFAISQSCAVPVKSEWQTFTQPDGSRIMLLPVGDEFVHYFITKDSIPVVIDSENSMACYAKLSDGHLFSSGIMAHEASIRTRNDFLAISLTPEKIEIDDIWRKKHGRWQCALAERRQGKNIAINHKAKAFSFGDRTPTIGEKKGIIILVDFPNGQFTPQHDHAFYDAMINKKGYTDELGHIGSVRDYFYDQSYGLFNPSFDVLGPVTMSHNYEYYGKDGVDIDVKIGELIEEACLALDEKVDFSQYDWNGDGEVDQVFFIYAGKGQATYPSNSNLIWPHMSSLSAMLGRTITADGVTINTYACCNERYGTYDRAMGIGTICHEFSHCLGLPDTYDTVGGYATGSGLPGKFDLMASGNYNGPYGKGEIPASFTAYGKYLAGWLQYKELRESQDISNLASSLDADDAYIIYNDAHEDEYYVIENRQKTSWDTYIPTAGLTLLHIDFNTEAWENNEINANNSLLLMTYLMSAPGANPKYTFPYNGVNSVSEEAFKPHHSDAEGKKSIHKTISDIVQHGDKTISFRFENNTTPTEITNPYKECTEIIKFYNLNGLYIGKTKPEKSGIYIVVKDNVREKIIVK